MKTGDLVKFTKVVGKVNATLPMGHEVVGLLTVFEEGLGLLVYGHGPEDSVRTSPVEMLTYDGDKKAYCHTKSGSLWKVELLEQKEE
jgi:hypothetical protein